jgi:cytoskeletal protein RodZ
VSIGEDLAAARHQAGLTVQQVSERTRIRQTIIRGIEQDDFSACGGDFYTRGHIRAIAHSVGVDGESLVQRYDSSRGKPPASATASSPGFPGLPGPPRPGPRRVPRWSALVLILLVAAAAGLVIYHAVASHRPPGVPAAAPKPSGVHQPARKHPATASTPIPPAARHGAHEVVISLAALDEPCWVDLTSPGGTTIFASVVPPGTSKTWIERRTVTLELGNPGAVTLKVDGRTRAGLGSQPVTLRLSPAAAPR